MDLCASCIIIILLSELRLNTELENGYRVQCYDLIKREERVQYSNKRNREEVFRD